VNSLAAWPYNIIKNLKFTANGASQLISASGWTLRAREIAKDEGLNDRGVVQTIGGSSRNQGTLSLGCESWGVGSATNALTAGTYAVTWSSSSRSPRTPTTSPARSSCSRPPPT
jgi:hypothetical protein